MISGVTFKIAQLRLYVGLISKKSAQTNQQVAQTAYETFQKCFFFFFWTALTCKQFEPQLKFGSHKRHSSAQLFYLLYGVRLLKFNYM